MSPAASQKALDCLDQPIELPPRARDARQRITQSSLHSSPASARRGRTSGDSLWTVQDVASFLKVSRSWVYQRTERGALPCLRVGGLVRFEPSVIRAWARGERAALEPGRSPRSEAGATIKREE